MKILMWLLDLLYPPKCAFCGTLVPKERHRCCTKCEEILPFTKNGGRLSGNFFTVCLSPLYYEEEVRDALLRYKFQKKSAYCEPFGIFLAKCVDEFLEEDIDFVTWVPLSRKRLKKRGYDQAQLLAEQLAECLKLPCFPVLKKVVHTYPQSKTGSIEKRRANISGAYQVQNRQAVSGKTILLVDDIVTTGATLSECARMLGMAGAERVCCAALARKHND